MKAASKEKWTFSAFMLLCGMTFGAINGSQGGSIHYAWIAAMILAYINKVAWNKIDKKYNSNKNLEAENGN